jgi:hypothetical protein
VAHQEDLMDIENRTRRTDGPLRTAARFVSRACRALVREPDLADVEAWHATHGDRPDGI